MVDVEIIHDEQKAILKTDKTTVTYTLEKDITGFRFFEFRLSKGYIPKDLEGKYTSLEKGIEAFKKYEKTLKQSQASKNEELDKARKARNAKLHTETS
jgi:hypothetical protein